MNAEPIRSALGAFRWYSNAVELPYDAEVEYLQSTGTQWIDTGVLSRSDVDFTIYIQPLKGGDTKLFGVYGDASYIGTFGTSWRLASGTFGWITYGTLDFNAITEISLIGLEWYVDGEYVYTVRGRGNTNVTLKMFGWWYSGSLTKTPQRLFGLVIYQNGLKVRDFIPVRVGEEGCMYDRVTGEIFGNDGTGEFIVGPDKE